MDQSLLNSDSAAPSLTTLALEVHGMECAGCVQTVEKQLQQQPGVISASVNLVTEMAMVACEVDTDPETLAAALTKAGFPSQPPDDLNPGAAPGLDPETEQRQQLIAAIQKMAIALTLVFLSGLGHLGEMGWFPSLGGIWFHWGLATIALAGPGRLMLMDGWQGLRRNAPNMNTLVSLGTLSAYTASLVALGFPQLNWECFFDEPVMIVGLILLGRTLEQQAKGRAASAFKALLALQPPTARWLPHQDQTSADSVEVPVTQVKPGAWLQVFPGERFPVDGEIVVGQTLVNESMLTGESLPTAKGPGDQVTGGTLNQSGGVTLEVTRTGKDTALAQIIALVEAAQTRKAPVQRLADLVAGYFTYGVMAIAGLTFLFWYRVGTRLWVPADLVPTLVMHNPGAEGLLTTVAAEPSPLLLSLKLAIAVLVVACPCALGLATPTAILVGTSLGAERGLLIRGGDVLEQVQDLDVVVFDKTGTLTTGNPVVTDCWVADHFPAELNPTPEQFLQIAATVEGQVCHPLASAIQAEAEAQGLALLAGADFQTQPGSGVSATVEGQQVILGTAEWLAEQGVAIPSRDQTQGLQLATAGKSLVYGAIAGIFVGAIAVADTLKPDAGATVARLKAMGLQVKVLTGDHPQAAAAMVQPLQLSSEAVLANVRPSEKAAAIAQLQAGGQRVAMVGDGSNDAPALAQADVGIALSSGTDVAVETAQIVLMRSCAGKESQLADVVEAIHLSQATFGKIKQNLFWAFTYNLVGIPVAAGVLLPSLGIVLSPAAAGALMAFSSVSVVTNSLLLRYTLLPKAQG